MIFHEVFNLNSFLRTICLFLLAIKTAACLRARSRLKIGPLVSMNWARSSWNKTFLGSQLPQAKFSHPISSMLFRSNWIRNPHPGQYEITQAQFTYIRCILFHWFAWEVIKIRSAAKSQGNGMEIDFFFYIIIFFFRNKEIKIHFSISPNSHGGTFYGIYTL